MKKLHEVLRSSRTTVSALSALCLTLTGTASMAQELNNAAPLAGCAPLCNGGACTPTLLADYGSTTKIALTANEVYFSGGVYPYINNGYVGRVPKAGGTASLFLRDLATTTSVQDVNGEIYILGSASPLPKTVSRLNANGSLTGITNTTGWPDYFTGNATHLHWVNWTTGDIYGVPRTGGTPFVIAQTGTASKVREVLADNNNVYWVNRTANNKGWNLWRAPKTGGATPTLFLSVPVGKFHALALDTNDIYFLDYYTGLNKLSKSGGAVTNIAYADEPGNVLAVDNERVYWIKDEVFTATCKDGSSEEALTSETYSTDDIAVDGSGIYWSQFYKVWKIAK